ncbi:MAG: hypothetical protein QM581_01585 [Pseudomonas sp.]
MPSSPAQAGTRRLRVDARCSCSTWACRTTLLASPLPQRLVRALCPHCKRPQALEPAQSAALFDDDEASPDNPTTYLPVGCLPCRRTGPYALLPVSAGLRALIRNDMGLAGFSRAAHAEGLCTLRRTALERVAEGLVTIEEVLPVLPSRE